MSLCCGCYVFVVVVVVDCLCLRMDASEGGPLSGWLAINVAAFTFKLETVSQILKRHSEGKNLL